MSHHLALLVAYGTALAGWIVAARLRPALWPRREHPGFAHPWREVGYAMLAVAAVLGLGQLYVRQWLLPPLADDLNILADAANQAIIFSPMFLLLVVRRQSLDTAWLPRDHVWLRVGAGLLLALVAIFVFSLVREGSPAWPALVRNVYRPANTSHLVQVLCEDAAIAILFVRFRAAIGTRATIGIVAALFALGHVPAMVASGATLAECARLVLDVGLGVIVLAVLQRSADIWWFWGVHFAMDMMQFQPVDAGALGAIG